MQDNKNFNDSEFNGEFIDRAWDQMSAMLDQEMPVVVQATTNDGWKRYLLLVLSLGLGVFIGASLVLFWPSAEEEAIPSNNSDQERVYAESGNNSGAVVSDNNSGDQPPDMVQLHNTSKAPVHRAAVVSLTPENNYLINNQTIAYTSNSTFTPQELINSIPEAKQSEIALGEMIT